MYQIKTVVTWTGALALALASSIALAQAVPAGAWKGAAQVGGKPVRIDVAFQGDAADVRFGSPYDCRIGGKYAGKQQDAAIYAFGVSVAGGQPCNNLSATGRMAMTSSADRKLHLTIDEKTRDGVRHWQADLEPAAP
ncbi:hypothetical protein L2Y94_18795 [Luteibacter aegosomatis]|uniref:hypothetical protein n=1 Tax=Luteibacter aegosomatis TaxID=2911537 RepID=UPI001FF8ED39|nr:hypothetical protein [Luteibacter aegosomatis]UPG85328.1 hypothetical protein L2Y94_18795 [Luteibacter aegosomatis]